jgi:hypothetical protein
MDHISNFESFKKINELTEFNLQRFNTAPTNTSVHVDNPQLSVNAFDRHEDNIRVAMSRINDIMYSINNVSNFGKLKDTFLLKDQDIQSLTIIRIVKIEIKYDVYVKFKIKDKEYWGVIKDILGLNVKFKSEVFNDSELVQTKDWNIKINGIVINTIKKWLMPAPNNYILLNDYIICNSIESGTNFKIQKGSEIELVRSHPNKIVIKYENVYYNLINDNYIYFNWWFKKID